METKDTGREAVARAATPTRVVEPQVVHLPGMPFGWVMAFACLGFASLITAFYCGHRFSTREVVVRESPSISKEDMRQYAAMAALEIAKGYEKNNANIQEKIDALSSEIAKIESRMAEMPGLIQGDLQKVMDRMDQGLIPRMSKGSETMLDMTETFDGEFKTLDARYGEVASLLRSIKEKQADLDVLKKTVGDGNVKITQLSERLNALNERHRELAAVLKNKLPNAEEIKAASFGVDFPPPEKK